MTAKDAAASAPAAREFEAHRRFLWGLAYRLTGSAADADDIVQETFLRALERPPAMRDDGWRAWLARVAANLALDALRRRKRQAYVGPWLPSPVETGDESSTPGVEVATDGMTTEHRYDLIESVSMAFLVALERLTPRQRAVLILRDVFDYTVAEAASALGLSEANVKVTHHRARAAMAAYDGSRVPPTRDHQARAHVRLQEFLGHLENQDVAGVEAMLAEDVRFVADSAGEYTSARQPVIGRDRVVRLLVGLAGKQSPDARIAVRMLNGEPALVVDVPPRPGLAPRYVIRLDLDRAGRIREVQTIVASRKLSAVGAG